MVTYLVLSYVLSGIGLLIYQFGIKNRASKKQRKYIIYLIVLLSILLPSFIIQAPSTLFGPKEHVHLELPDEMHDEPILNDELIICYNEAKNQDDFCQCEILQQSSIVLYKPNRFYNFLLAMRAPLVWTFIGFGLLLLLTLILRIIYLEYIIRNSHISTKTIEGKSYHILKPQIDLPVGSFRLRQKYIIWEPILDHLDETEQYAVLLHEIAHLDNRDTWEQIGLSILQFFWFINPLFYFIKKEINLLNEYIADSFAVSKTGDVKAYANLLVKMKTQQQVLLTQQFGKHPLELRVQELFQPEKRFSRSGLLVMLTCGLMLLSSAASAYVLYDQTADFEEYCLLYEQHETTGKNYFCKTCLLEKFKNTDTEKPGFFEEAEKAGPSDSTSAQ